MRTPLEKRWNSNGKRARPREVFRSAASPCAAQKVLHASRETPTNKSRALNTRERVLTFRATRAILSKQRKDLPPDEKPCVALPFSHCNLGGFLGRKTEHRNTAHAHEYSRSSRQRAEARDSEQKLIKYSRSSQIQQKLPAPSRGSRIQQKLATASRSSRQRAGTSEH